VTVGSLTGMLGTYKCTDYSASKFATVGFHESLLTELKVCTKISLLKSNSL
jgi:all-trans-retinol dehydrogenase (NAD+)